MTTLTITDPCTITIVGEYITIQVHRPTERSAFATTTEPPGDPEPEVKPKPHIEQFGTDYGHIRFHAVAADGTTCGHQHRYEAPAKACLKNMLQ